MNIAVLGAGAFGTAIAKSLEGRGHEVTLWARTEEGARDYVAKDTLRDITFAMNFSNAGAAKAAKDYFLQAKDYYDDWADFIAVSEVTIDGDTASMLVALGDPAQGTKRLALTLVREDGGWKISRVNEAAASK